MNIWEWLDISPTTDIAKIKSAYARQAKRYHPEEHPEEFKALQRAYKEAVSRARNQNAGSFNIPPEQPADMSGQRPEQKQAEDSFRKEPEYSFDYSDVDAYGDRERFCRHFLLLARNPYLRNNLHTWEHFLHQDMYSRLFENADFRTRFIRCVCGVAGWRRKTILYFEKFLLSFHTEQNVPAGGKWETELMCFRLEKLPHLRLPAFFMDRFWGKEGRSLYKQMHIKISREMGRELNLDLKSDVIRYMKLYLLSVESKEDYVEHLHRGWIVQQISWGAVGIVICLVLVFSERYSVEKRNKSAENLMRAEYLMELYELESGSCSREEQLEILRDYDRRWKDAEEAIDDVLERYESW